MEEKLQINKHTQTERDGVDRMLKSKRPALSELMGGPTHEELRQIIDGENTLAEQTTHQPLPVSGYKPQSDANVKLVNCNKQIEEVIIRIMDMMKTKTTIDQRWLAIARTQIEQGFMAMNRAVFQPGRVKLDDTNLDFLQALLDAVDTAIL